MQEAQSELLRPRFDLRDCHPGLARTPKQQLGALRLARWQQEAEEDHQVSVSPNSIQSCLQAGPGSLKGDRTDQSLLFAAMASLGSVE